MSEEKTFYPEVVPETPFPNEVEVPIISSGQNNTSGTYSPTVVKDQPFKKKVISQETIASSLNTRSRKILESFDLEQRGAIQIGSFKEGTTGDLRLTPNGLTARDKAGLTTFAIDGTSGDAVFKGTIQSGSVISGTSISDSSYVGDITVGGNNNVNGEIHVLDSASTEKVTIDKDGILVNSGKITIKDSGGTAIVDATGLVSSANFNIAQATNVDVNQTVDDNDTWVDVTGLSSLQVSPTRTVNILIMMEARGWLDSDDGSSAFGATVYLGIDIDGVLRDYQPIQRAFRMAGGDTDGTAPMSISAFYFVSLEVGNHPIKMRAKCKNVSGAQSHYFLQDGSYGYVVLGT